jgi:glycosyltransferase involved in cell wall biosynthesis
MGRWNYARAGGAACAAANLGPMKICFLGPDTLAVLAPRFHPHPVFGADAVQQALLARALARRGHEVSTVVADGGQHDGAQWERVRAFKAGAHWAGTWSALARADAELYYTSGAGAHVGLLALYCARHRKRCVVRAATCGGSRLHRFGLRHAHAVLAPDDAQQQALARQLGVASRVARALVDRAAAAAARDIDLLWVGRHAGARRPDRMLSLARRLPLAHAHMAGGPQPGEEVVFREMRRMAADVPNLTFHGPLPYAEANALYARAKLLVGTWDEPHLPHAYLQAWAHGVPVAALADPEGVIAREGLGVVAASPCRLLEKVQALLDDEGAWRAASARCTHFMAREYGEARVLRPYLAAFDEALRGLPAAPGAVAHA